MIGKNDEQLLRESEARILAAAANVLDKYKMSGISYWLKEAVKELQLGNDPGS